MSGREIVIIGAGPAGSMAALLLARRGYAVTVLEKDAFPRAKLCGGFISPLAVEVLRRHEVDLFPHIPHRRVEGVRVVASDGRGFAARLGRHQTAWGVSRAEFDDRLAELAAAAGARIHQNTRVRSVSLDTDPLVATDDAEFRPRVLIGAGGRACPVRRALAGRPPAEERVGMAFHFRDANSDEAATIGAFPSGYGGIVQMGADRMNLCFVAATDWLKSCGGDENRILAEGPFRNPELARRVGHLERLDGPFSTTPVYLPTVHSEHPRVHVAGDAAGFVEPFTGYGIAKALQQGAAVAERVHGRLSGTNGHAAESPARQRQSEAVLHAIRDAAIAGRLDEMVHRLGHWPRVTGIMVRAIYSPSPVAGWMGERLLRWVG